MRCFSMRATSAPAEKASKVVMLDGTLREFNRAAAVIHVIDGESDCIVFDTNKLLAGEYVLPLEPHDELEFGHVYMLLPHSMLHHQLDSADIEKLSTKVKEALLMADLDKKFEGSGSFCGLREMFSGQDTEERVYWREVKKEKKDDGEEQISNTEDSGKTNKVEASVEGSASKRLGDGKGKVNKRASSGEEKKEERKQSKCQYIWYLGFASLPIEDEI